MVDTEHVRLATADDAAAMGALQVASLRFGDTHTASRMALSGLDPEAWSRMWAGRIDSDGTVLIADVTGELHGFVWLGPTTDPDDDPASVGQVRAIHVAPSQVGQGVSQALLAAARRHLYLAGYASATLWVASRDVRAKRIYARDGWTPDGRERAESPSLSTEDLAESIVERLRCRLDKKDRRDPAARVPKYYSVKQKLRKEIEGSPPGTPLRPERVLSEEFGASRSTVRQALLELAVEGRIIRMQGRGTFVAPPKETLPLQLRSYTEDWLARGLSSGSRLLESRIEPADAVVAEQLGLPHDAPILMLERLRLTDGVPMALEIAHLDASRFAEVADLMSDGVSLYELLSVRWAIEPVSALQTIETVLASPQVADLLGAEAGTPVLLLTRRTHDQDGQPFEFVRSVYRGDRYRFAATLVRPQAD